MRLLYVSFIDPEEESKYGGAHGCHRNFCLIKKNFEVDKYIIKRRSTFSSLLSLLEGRMAPERNKDVKNIINKLRSSCYDAVWFDSSMHGELIKRIAGLYPNIKIYTYFHNVEQDYIDIRIGNKIKRRIYRKLARKQEGLTVKYADIKFTLSERDKNRLNMLYGNSEYIIMPVSFDDRYEEDKRIVEKQNVCYGLFVGAYGRANMESIVWFLKNTSIGKNVTIQIVGKGFEKYRDVLEGINKDICVEVIGTVENLSEYYYNADFVLAPISIGAGMKVKIAEALMYGKTIIGTEEAFVGYDGDLNKVGVCSNDIEEIDKGIERVLKNEFSYKFNENSRLLFLEKYSTDAVECILRQVFI